MMIALTLQDKAKNFNAYRHSVKPKARHKRRKDKKKAGGLWVNARLVLIRILSHE